jgi:hypothetical protein
MLFWAKWRISEVFDEILRFAQDDKIFSAGFGTASSADANPQVSVQKAFTSTAGKIRGPAENAGPVLPTPRPTIAAL